MKEMLKELLELLNEKQSEINDIIKDDHQALRVWNMFNELIGELEDIKENL